MTAGCEPSSKAERGPDFNKDWTEKEQLNYEKRERRERTSERYSLQIWTFEAIRPTEC